MSSVAPRVPTEHLDLLLSNKFEKGKVAEYYELVWNDSTSGVNVPCILKILMGFLQMFQVEEHLRMVLGHSIIF